ncbi:MAG: hypothetical protein PHV32_18605 [Eubacteriales bacterium]|nr:hypothetical protein [Eubacteriales bacterium]
MFNSDTLYCISLKQYEEKTIESFIKEINVKDIETSKKLASIERILGYDKMRLIYNERIAEFYSLQWEKLFSKDFIIKVRLMLCEKFQNEILWYKSLYFNSNPLITENEIHIINDIETIFKLINKESDDFNTDTVSIVHGKVMALSIDEMRDKKIIDFYEELIGMFEEVDIIHTLIEYMKRIKQVISTFEVILLNQIIGKNVNIDEYKIIINLQQEEERKLSDNTLKNIRKLKIYSGLNRAVCRQLFDKEYFLEYIYNISVIDLNEVSLIDDNIKNTIESDCLEIYNTNPKLWNALRKIVLQKHLPDINNWRFMFARGYPMISEEEIVLIDDIFIVIDLIDITQIDEDNINIFITKFNNAFRNSPATYKILEFIFSISDQELSIRSFYQLDMKTVKYSMMSKDKKKQIKTLYSSIKDLTDADEIIKYMKHTNELDFVLERMLTKKLADNKDLSQEYVSLINQVDKYTDMTYANIKKMNYLHSYTDGFNAKLFEKKLYLYYVSSIILKSRQFIIDHENLNVLWDTYVTIISSSGYGSIKLAMSENIEFLNLLAKKELYIGMPNENRKYFSKIRQSVMLLDNLTTYEMPFIIEYLREIDGFDSKEAAKKFIVIASENIEIARDSAVYSNVHEKLVDSGLKGRYTRLYKKTNKK